MNEEDDFLYLKLIEELYNLEKENDYNRDEIIKFLLGNRMLEVYQKDFTFASKINYLTDSYNFISDIISVLSSQVERKYEEYDTSILGDAYICLNIINSISEIQMDYFEAIENYLCFIIEKDLVALQDNCSFFLECEEKCEKYKKILIKKNHKYLQKIKK